MESNKIVNETFYNIRAVVKDIGRFAFQNSRIFPGFDIMPFLSGEEFKSFENGHWAFYENFAWLGGACDSGEDLEQSFQTIIISDPLAFWKCEYSLVQQLGFT